MSATPYRPDIDGLRAVAVLAVVAFHAWPHALTGGFVGVDVFFVISGFLITRILLAPDFSFAGFYRRRVRRLAPALLLTIATTLVVGALILPPDGLRRMLGHAIGGTLFVANVVSYLDSGYFGGDADLRPFLHLWSLGVEEQFYLAWPVAIWWARRHGAVSRLVLVGAAASLATYLWLGEHDPRAAFFLPWSRFWELMAGALMLKVELSRRWSGIASTLGLALIAASFVFVSSEVDYPGLWLTLPVLGTCLVLAARNAPLNVHLLASRPAVFIGLVSYPLYLWHWPLLSLLRNVDRSPSSVAIAAVLALAGALAVATWLIVERPLVRLPIGRVSAGLAAGLVALTAGAAVARATVSQEPNPLVNAPCSERYPYQAPGLWFCLLSKDAPPTVLLLGDSHAHHLYEGMAKALPSETVLAIGACAPTPGLRYLDLPDATGTCVNANFELQSKYLDRTVVAGPELRWVVLAAMWRTFDAAGEEIDYWSGKPAASFLPREPTALDAYVASIARQLDRLGNVPVTIVLDTPRRGLAVDVQRLRREPLLVRLRQLADGRSNVRVVDAFPVLCGDAWCRWNRLRDANHLTHAGSAEVAAAITARAAPLATP